MKREYYSDSIDGFLDAPETEILGKLAERNTFSLETSQRDAWIAEIRILKSSLLRHRGGGAVYFEYSIPRLGKRIDVVAIVHHVIFVLEFKIGGEVFTRQGLDQVWDYALDLANFHEPSREALIAPILIATRAEQPSVPTTLGPKKGNVRLPFKCNIENLAATIEQIIASSEGQPVDTETWHSGSYLPTPTIIEAAIALYAGHAVTDVARHDAAAINLSQTSDAVSRIIESARKKSHKSICFVTGVPGAGKTLVGLNLATRNMDSSFELYSVFLSGNGPLVAILREALARDKNRRAKELGQKSSKNVAMREVRTFIQNVHNFRDDCLADPDRPPAEHVVLFDEAQRAWNLERTSSFMRRKKGMPGFDRSEPEFLISCLDRHRDWAVIVCLVGGGQEINTGEAGISEWVDALVRSYQHWHVHISSRLVDSEYAAGNALERIKTLPQFEFVDELHLSVSMRSFRAESVALLIKQLLDLEHSEARNTFRQISNRYPIVITRDLREAKRWLRTQASGSERIGIIASSQAQRLKPEAIDVRSPIDPIHWFLDGKEDVRSSYYLEDVATEFHVQGLELDWACVAWDADFRYCKEGWEHKHFCGDRWNNIKATDRQKYLKNAYRVLMTRARQGMVIFVPNGHMDDPTKSSHFYDRTFEYLASIGFPTI